MLPSPIREGTPLLWPKADSPTKLGLGQKNDSNTGFMRINDIIWDAEF